MNDVSALYSASKKSFLQFIYSIVPYAPAFLQSSHDNWSLGKISHIYNNNNQQENINEIKRLKQLELLRTLLLGE